MTLDRGDGAASPCQGRCLGRNEARYYVKHYSGEWVLRYCGLCDLHWNGGAGKLAREIWCEACGGSLLHEGYGCRCSDPTRETAVSDSIYLRSLALHLWGPGIGSVHFASAPTRLRGIADRLDAMAGGLPRRFTVPNQGSLTCPRCGKKYAQIKAGDPVPECPCEIVRHEDAEIEAQFRDAEPYWGNGDGTWKKGDKFR